ncbi:MAG: hypothetical protein ABIH42_02720 [Planctomycetota bacterium]
MKLMAKVSVFLFIVLFCTTAFAETISVRLAEWEAKFNMELAVSKNYSAATDITAKMIGLEMKKYTPALEISFSGVILKTTLSYWDVTFGGERTLDLGINFYGMQYDMNHAVESEIRITSYDLRWQFNLLPISVVQLGVIAGARINRYSAQITDMTANFTAGDSAYAGAPYLGISAEVNVSSFQVGANIVSFSYKNEQAGFQLNRYMDTNLYAQMSLFPFVSARTGYYNFQLDFETTGADAFRLGHYIKGPYLAICIGF